jgi:hypothetical protein
MTGNPRSTTTPRGDLHLAVELALRRPDFVKEPILIGLTTDPAAATAWGQTSRLLRDLAHEDWLQAPISPRTSARPDRGASSGLMSSPRPASRRPPRSGSFLASQYTIPSAPIAAASLRTRSDTGGVSPPASRTSRPWNWQNAAPRRRPTECHPAPHCRRRGAHRRRQSIISAEPGQATTPGLPAHRLDKEN